MPGRTASMSSSAPAWFLLLFGDAGCTSPWLAVRLNYHNMLTGWCSSCVWAPGTRPMLMASADPGSPTGMVAGQIQFLLAWQPGKATAAATKERDLGKLSNDSSSGGRLLTAAH